VLRQEWGGFGLCLSIEVYENLFASGYDLLERCDLHQLPAADRAPRSLQADDQVSPLFSKLYKRERVIHQLVHWNDPCRNDGL
jgi:hypothetical protein